MRTSPPALMQTHLDGTRSGTKSIRTKLNSRFASADRVSMRKQTETAERMRWNQAWPFVLGAVAPFPLAALGGDGETDVAKLWLAGVLLAVLAMAAFAARRRWFPRWADLAIPLGYFGVVEFLRESGGGPLAGYGALAFLPIVWLALHRTWRGLVAGIVALFVSRAIPVLLGAGSGHAGADWRGVTLTVLIAAFIGLSIRRLVREVHDHAADQDEQKEEIQRVGDLFASVLAAATEVSILATDADGVITVFNAGAERMLGYRAEELIGVRTPQLFHAPSEVLSRAKELGISPGFAVLIHTARFNEPETR
jgi:PAS domain-containing protein